MIDTLLQRSCYDMPDSDVRANLGIKKKPLKLARNRSEILIGVFR